MSGEASIAGAKVWVCLNDDCAAVYDEWPGKPHCRACGADYGAWAIRWVKRGVLSKAVDVSGLGLDSSSVAESGGTASPKSDSPCQSEGVQGAIDRLTRATCSFAQHIDREGVGWSKMRHDDVCAVLGEVERLERASAALVPAARYAEGALSVLANHYDLLDLTETAERAISNLRSALSSEAPSPQSEAKLSAGKEALDEPAPTTCGASKSRPGEAEGGVE